MNNAMSTRTSTGRIVMGSALGGIVIMGLVALGISTYDGYTDELLVYQSLALGLIGGLIISGIYLLFTRVKSTQPPKYQPPVTGYTTPLQSKRTPIRQVETPNNQFNSPVESKPLFKRILSYIAYFSAFTMIGIIVGFVGGVIYMLANLGEIFEDAANQYSILIIILLPLQLICMLLASMGIGGIAGAIIGFIFKVFRKQSQTL
jgi:hypothetical protein